MNSSNKNPTFTYKKGQDALKTSFFSLKFNPDYLSAVSYFTDAAKEFKKLKMFKESIKAFEDAIKCNKQLLESWAEAKNYQEVADIYIFELNDFNSGLTALKNSSLSYKYSGKFTSGIKVYTDFAQRMIELKANYNGALIVLKEGFEDCLEHTHDELIRISLEESFNALLDVYCHTENYVAAIDLIEKYIKIQKNIKEEKKHKISKNYLKLGMLRIIIDESYMADNLVDEMYTVYHADCSDDIDDLRKLIKAFKEGNKKDFSYLITYAFSLFQNNLLKALKKIFDVKLEQLMVSNNTTTGSNSTNNAANNRVINIHMSEGFSNVDLESNYSCEETKANSEIGKDLDMQSEISRNVFVNNNADDYL